MVWSLLCYWSQERRYYGALQSYFGRKVPVAFGFVKRFPFELVDHCGEDTIEEGDTDMLNDDERAALADEQDIMANEQDIPFYNQTEMERIGAYHVEQILRGQYRQGWLFLTKWECRMTESTWEPVRAFVHDDGKLNHVFVDYCLAHTPPFDTALRQARRISSTLKRSPARRNPTKRLPWKTRNQERSVPRRSHSSAEANGDVQKSLQLVIWQKTGYFD